MIVDVHCHLTDDYFKDKLDKVISNAEKKNVVSIITNGLNFKDNLNVLKLSKKYNLVKASFGLYPLDAVKLNEKELSLILEQIKKNKNNIVGIGEIGMDFKYNNEFEKQKEIFSNIIEISEKIKKPLIIHSRGAEKEVPLTLEKLPLIFVVFIETPGATNFSKSLLLYVNSSFLFTAPAAVTFALQAGCAIPDVVIVLPEEATNNVPLAVAFAMSISIAEEAQGLSEL